MRLICADGRREVRPEMCASKLNCMERRSKAVGEAEAGYQQLSDIDEVARFTPDRVGSYDFGASICRGGCWFCRGYNPLTQKIVWLVV